MRILYAYVELLKTTTICSILIHFFCPKPTVKHFKQFEQNCVHKTQVRKYNKPRNSFQTFFFTMLVFRIAPKVERF